MGKLTLRRPLMVDYCVFLLYRAGVWLLTFLPLPALFALGQFAGTLAWIFSGTYRGLAFHNVRIAFGDELSNRAARRLIRRHFQRLGANLLCSVKLSHMPLDKIRRRVRVENIELIQNCLRSGQPVVLFLSHLASWELCAQMFPSWLRGYRTSTVYQRMRNRYIDEHVRAARARFGLEVFERSEGFGPAIDLLRDGGAIGILADQHAGDQGIWTPFFGRLASTTPLPALMAKRTGAQLIAFAIVTDGFARWRAIAEPPISDLGDTIESLTARGNQLIEWQVRRAPEDWFWVHNRWKTPRPNFLLTKYKRGVFVPETTALEPFRILIRSSNWLGDAVMTVPAVRAIKRGRPDAQVTVAAPEKIAAVWKLVSEVDEIISLPSRSVFAIARLLQKGPPYDAAILFPNSLRSALEVFLARIPRRVGFAGHSRRWLLNQSPRGKPSPGIVHQTSKYLKLAETLGADVGFETFAARPIRSGGDRLKFGLCPGAEYGPAKRWLPERFAEVALEIATRLPVQWILFGTQNEVGLGAQITDALGDKCLNRVGSTTLEQLITELRECDLLLTNDTGSMHLAALLGVPIIAIFGSTEPRLTGPVGPAHRVIRRHVECSPCFLRECPLDLRCMREVTSAEVITAVLEIASTEAIGGRVPG